MGKDLFFWLATMKAESKKRSSIIFLLGFLLIFSLGLGVRAYGLGHELPYMEDVDEFHLYQHGLLMYLNGDPDPHWYNYPTLFVYVESDLYALHYAYGLAAGLYQANVPLRGLDWDWNYIYEPDFFLWGRVGALAFGVATLAVLFVAARRMGEAKYVALLATLLLALSQPHVFFSQWIRTDIALTFFVPLSFLFSLAVAETGLTSAYVLAGLASGLAIATKYNGFVIVLPTLVAHLYRVRGRGWRGLITANAFLGAVAIPLGFALGAPFDALNLPAVRAALGQVANRYQPGEGGLSSALFYLTYFAQSLGPITFALAIAGMLFLFWRRRVQDVMAVSFPLAYFIFLSAEETTYSRNALVLTPFLALFAAVAVAQIARGLSSRLGFLARREAALAFVLVALILIPSALTIVRADMIGSTPTTRIQATAWAEANLPPNAKVMSEPGGIKLSSHFDEAVPEVLASHPASWYLNRRFDYLIHAPQEGDPAPPAWLSQFEQIQEFAPGETVGGPPVRIYRLPVQPLPVRLVRAQLSAGRVSPGTSVRVTLDWSAAARLYENYGIFIHLINAAGDTIAQDDTQPITKDWTPGATIHDQHVLKLADDLAPGRYTVQAGFVRVGNDRRMPLEGGQTELEAGALAVAPGKPPLANISPSHSLVAQFGENLELVGYDSELETVKRGERLHLALYWRAVKDEPSDHTVFAQLISREDRVIAQSDHRPAGGAYPTSIWRPGEVVRDEFTLDVAQNAAPGDHAMKIGLYHYPSLARLPVFVSGAHIANDALTIFHIRVE